MNEINDRQWVSMQSAPRDGTLVLVAIHASEQGPAEIDAVRWMVSGRSGEGGWVANDSDPFARIVYAEGELAGWSPLPTQMPKLRSSRPAEAAVPSPLQDESDGAGI
jgi:hypothetical protein